MPPRTDCRESCHPPLTAFRSNHSDQIRAHPPKLSQPWHWTATASPHRGRERNAREPPLHNYVLLGIGIRHANGSGTSAASGCEVPCRVLSATAGRAQATRLRQIYDSVQTASGPGCRRLYTADDLIVANAAPSSFLPGRAAYCSPAALTTHGKAVSGAGLEFSAWTDKRGPLLDAATLPNLIESVRPSGVFSFRRGPEARMRGSGEMALAYKVMVRCPETGRRIDSGIRTSGREAINSGLFQSGTISCPHCGHLHSFESNSFLDVDRASSVTGLWRPNR